MMDFPDIFTDKDPWIEVNGKIFRDKWVDVPRKEPIGVLNEKLEIVKVFGPVRFSQRKLKKDGKWIESMALITDWSKAVVVV